MKQCFKLVCYKALHIQSHPLPHLSAQVSLPEALPSQTPRLLTPYITAYTPSDKTFLQCPDGSLDAPLLADDIVELAAHDGGGGDHLVDFWNVAFGSAGAGGGDGAVGALEGGAEDGVVGGEGGG